MENRLLINYPQKINLLIEFPYEIVNIHNSFDYLEDKWDDIVDHILHIMKIQELNVLSHSTEFDERFTIISYHLIFLVNPPYLDVNFIAESILNYDNNLKFKIKSDNKYDTEYWLTLYNNQ